MKSKPIRVEVVAPVHNRKDITLQCLKSLARAATPGFEVHVIVVDDGSTDGTGDAIRLHFPSVELVTGDGDLWFTEGTNVGVRAALRHDPDYVLMMNDDQVFDDKFLLHLVETADRYPRSVVGPLLLLWDTPHKLFQTAPVWSTMRGGWVHWRKQTIWTVPSKPWAVDMIVGNCILVPAAAFHECGLMDSRRYPNFGDAEFTPRLKKRGWRLLIDPRSRVFCQPNSIMPSLSGMGPRELYSALIRGLGNGNNLRRRFYSYIDGGPNKAAGTLAFVVFMIRALFRRDAERLRRDGDVEPPLSEVFRDAVVDD
ncbi:MAG: glycosyltransferase [Pyrinomonadaceae bacterium]